MANQQLRQSGLNITNPRLKILLRKAGLKITGPRLKILKILEEQAALTRHLSVEDIFKILVDMKEDVGLATIYRVLTQFESVDLVTRQNFEGGHCVFELNQGSHHDHLVCIKCNHIEEFIDPIIARQQQMIANQFGFRMTDYTLTLYGICVHCHSTISKQSDADLPSS